MGATVNSALNVLPTIPTFVLGESSLTNLNNLSYAVSFLCDCDVRPVYHAIMNATMSLSSGFNNVTGGFISIDTDNQGTTVNNAMKPVITTTGVYCFEFAAAIINSSANQYLAAEVLFTAGSNNPRYDSGATLHLGKKAGGTHAGTGSDTVYCISDITPIMYPGDSLQPLMYISTTGFSSDYNVNTNYVEGRFQTQLTTYYVQAAM